VQDSSNSSNSETVDCINSSHFNGLTPAEAERLAILMEEMGEAIQVIGKIQRHGYQSSHPQNPNGPTNRDLLAEEVGHVLHAINRMFVANDLDRNEVNHSERSKSFRITAFLHHQ
jgi:NTP pyrophosphatase (non-canonical NTP hydrolase)